MVYCFVILTFVCEVDGTFMGKFMAKFWQGLAGLWQNYIQAVVELWQRSGKKYGRVYGTGMANLWQSDGDICSHVISKFWPSCVKNMAKL